MCIQKVPITRDRDVIHLSVNKQMVFKIEATTEYPASIFADFEALRKTLQPKSLSLVIGSLIILSRGYFRTRLT